MESDLRLPEGLDPASVLLYGKFTPPEFVVRPFFPRGELTEIVGAHGNFKSTIALALCLAVASGRAWAGTATAQGRAVFITLEEATMVVAGRARAWLRGIFEPSEIAQAERDVVANFSFLAREKSQDLVLTTTRDGVTTARLDVADHLARLTDGASIVVLETVSRLHDGPETNEGFAALIRSLERIVRNGASVVLVRHTSKKTAREMTKAEDATSYAGRGGGSLSDAVRSSLIVTRRPGDPLNPITLTAAKTTHSRAGDSVSWRPVVVEELGAVRLEYQTKDIQTLDEADQVAAHLRAAGERGVTRSDLHKNPPAGLGRAGTFRGLEYLLAHGRAVPREEERGRNRQTATVYYAPGVVR